MAGKIYIAHSNVPLLNSIATPFEHLFLVYDEDGDALTTAVPGNNDEQRIIEGFPTGVSGFSNLVISLDTTIAGNSERELDANIDGDVNDLGDRNPYLGSDLNLTF